jgi:hypothetical protein|tara:strand:- start:50 stop:337 length:288 start_codon:yes stop_codon:yes gene_type:complete
MTETHLPKTTDMLHTLSLEQLTELKGQIQQMIDLKSPSLRVGMTVEVNHPRLEGRIGKIVKVNRIKCKVQFDNSGQSNKDETWNIPQRMIQPVFV